MLKEKRSYDFFNNPNSINNQNSINLFKELTFDKSDNNFN